MKNSEIKKLIEASRKADQSEFEKMCAENAKFTKLQNMDFEMRELLEFEENNSCRDMFYLCSEFDNEIDTSELTIVESDYFEDLDYAQNLEMINTTDLNYNYNGFIGYGEKENMTEYYY